MHADTIAAGLSSAFPSGVPSKVRVALRLINPGAVGSQAWYDMGARLALIIVRNILEAALVAAGEVENSDDPSHMPAAAVGQIRLALRNIARAYEEITGERWTGQDWLGPMEI